MPPQTVHIPNGQTYNVTPIFGGFTFKSNDLDIHHSAMPPGWTVNLNTEDEVDEDDERMRRRSRVYIGRGEEPPERGQKLTVSHRFTKPTLQSDSLFISSVSIPSSSDFKTAASPSRHVAMMLWATLCWYFHKEAPSPHVTTDASSMTPESGRPKGDWRIKIKREGIFKSRNTLQKLERMGLISTEESSVGIEHDPRSSEGWSECFVSSRAFWQTDPRIFLFTLAPVHHSPMVPASPFASRPSSPERGRDGVNANGPNSRGSPRRPDFVTSNSILPDLSTPAGGVSSPGGPFTSGSHLPTYYPAPPTQYIFTNHIRHPIRPKPPRQGETFYSRYIPSLESFLSFRVPTMSPKPVPYLGPSTPRIAGSLNLGANALPAQGPTSSLSSISVATLPTLANFTERLPDTEILHRWMNVPRVNAAWGEAGPISHTTSFLQNALSDRHSFPVFACFDGRPFAYFEIYWVKEDRFGRLLGGNVGNWTRGLHVLVGEEEFRGPHRVKVWLSALVHYCWLSDSRTDTVMMEPRVDNEK